MPSVTNTRAMIDPRMSFVLCFLVVLRILCK
jgi:hypothetical protein